ncbi:MAG TPA: fumarylacetoacetate hydrolase family protein [Acidobacteriaceae bacterium]|nr:fumarylacetoacetate hydrolase family protein [Acidobacteriaceae bacterium]
MKLYNTTQGILATEDDRTFHTLLLSDWDELVTHPDLHALVRDSLSTSRISAKTPEPAPAPGQILAPIGSQEVWAAGVTYYRSRSARIEESKDAGGGTFYDRVYAAERPELFFKATARRVVGPGDAVRIRTDATWSVPEPELTLLLNPAGNILGYTVGNDMSSRDIEGENPLYLPQAKVYDGSCALGPCVLLAEHPIPRTTAIKLAITRDGSPVFTGETTLAELKRDPRELASYLFRDSSFPTGAYLLTGTGIVPGDDFTLAHGDLVDITIDGIGTLSNTVA